MSKIGFLGLGAMGLPMAKRLCAAGHELVTAIHKNPAPGVALEKLGARIVDSQQEVAAGVDFLVTMLPQDKDIEEVMLSQRMIDAVDPKTIILEMSTTSGRMIRKLADFYAKKGVRTLDAPVSGGPEGAAAGTLTIMCGGDAEVFNTALPLLEVMGKNLRLVGGMGAGKEVKVVNNLVAAANTVIVAEALQLSRKLGLDLDAVYEIVKTSTGQSANFDIRFPRMVKDNYDGGFKLWLMIKDMRIALAESTGLSLPMSTLAYQLFEMTGDDEGELDFAVVKRIFDK